ncbi:MAG: hypothetical protein AAF845_14555 [Bacteroidota bacterium]
MLLLHLDAYHLGDPLFVTGLARDLQVRGAGAILVHGSAERGERAIESLGHEAVAVDGAWQPPDPEAAAAVEKAARDVNREIAHELNEAGIASVRVIGADRGLLRRNEGRLEVGRAGWIATLAGQGVVVVVAAFVEDGEPALREVSPLEATARLAGALEVPMSLLASKRVDTGPETPADDVIAALPDPEAAGQQLAAGVEVVVLQRSDLRANGAGRALRRERAAH